MRAYQWMLDRGSPRVIVAGDSSGCSLVLSFLLEEARELTDHAQDCGVDARFELFAVDTHDFHIFWSFLPEAAQALQQAGRFARETTLAAQAG